MPEDKSKKEEKPVKGVAGEKTGTEVLAEDKNNNIRDVINPREVIVTLGVLPIKGWADASTFEVGYYAGR